MLDGVGTRWHGKNNFWHHGGEVAPEEFELIADPACVPPAKQRVERNGDQDAKAGDDTGGRDSDDVDGPEDVGRRSREIADRQLERRSEGCDRGDGGADADADQAERSGLVAWAKACRQQVRAALTRQYTKYAEKTRR
jgi:hypothetical protein